MIEAIQSLLRLQEIDLRLFAARQEVASFGPRREAAAAARAREREAIALAERSLAEAERLHRDAERALADADALVAKLAAQLYEVTSKHALDALQNEQKRADTQKSEREDVVLSLLEEIDATTAELASTRDALRDGEEADARDDAAMAARERELTDEIARLEGARAERVTGLDAAILRAYDGARRKRLPAVVHAEAKMCPVCRMTLGPQKLIELTAAKVIVHCGTCDRILYGEKVADAERARAVAI